jgi:hypothetical protein
MQPVPAALTEADRQNVAAIAQQADDLADRILAAPVPALTDYRALHGLVAIADGNGLFVVTPRHTAALERSLSPADAAIFAERLARLAWLGRKR